MKVGDRVRLHPNITDYDLKSIQIGDPQHRKFLLNGNTFEIEDMRHHKIYFSAMNCSAWWIHDCWAVLTQPTGHPHTKLFK